jgi:hypothetical protein
MRFSWTGLILAPLLVPVMFSMIGAVMLSSPQEGGNPVLGFLVLLIPGCVAGHEQPREALVPIQPGSRYAPAVSFNDFEQRGRTHVRAGDASRSHPPGSAEEMAGGATMTLTLHQLASNSVLLVVGSSRIMWISSASPCLVLA